MSGGGLAREERVPPAATSQANEVRTHDPLPADAAHGPTTVTRKGDPVLGHQHAQDAATPGEQPAPLAPGGIGARDALGA